MKKPTLLLIWACLIFGVQAQNVGEKVLVHVPVNGNGNDFGPGYITATTHGGITYTTDSRGNANQALQLDGVDDYLSFGSQSVYHKRLPISFSVWVNVDDNVGNYPVFATDNTTAAYAGIIVSVAGGIVHMNYGDGVNFGTGNRSTLSSATKLNAGTWYHIAGVIRGYNNMDMYINGVKETAGTYSGSGSPNTMGYIGEGLSIGMYAKKGNGSDQFFKGKIDDLHIWNRELTENEVNLKRHMIVSYSMVSGGQLEDDGPYGLACENLGSPGTYDRFNKDGGAMDFNGNSYRLKLPNGNLHKIQFPFTISAWVKIHSQKTFQPIFATSDHVSSKYSGALLYLENGKPALVLGDNQGAGIQFRRSLVADDSIKSGQWYHITAVCTSLSSQKLYLNGNEILATTASGTGTLLAHGATNGYIGYLSEPNGGAARYFNGAIDEVMMLNKALGNTEVLNAVRHGVYITGQPKDTLVTPSSASILRINTTSTTTVSYQWQKKNTVDWTDVSSGKASILNISSTSDSDTGSYRCIASVSGRTDTSETASIRYIPTNKNGGGEVSEVVLSPNPAAGLLSISGFAGKIKWTIYTSSGKKMLSDQMNDPSVIDISALQPGTYIVEIKNGNNIYTTKIIIL